MSGITLAHIDRNTRIRLHLLTATAVLFLSIYGKVVCPFIDTLTFARLLAGLSAVWLFQVLLREGCYRLFPAPRRPVTLARHGFRLSVITWMLAGVAASGLHGFLYSDFHWTSHLKLLSGYWGLGAGILSQLEYVLLERTIRSLHPEATRTVLERIATRLTEGFFLFTLIPVMMMTLMSFRFVYEGYLERGAAFEVLFLGVCFLVASLLVSRRYGQALRQDCDRMLAAVEAVAGGRFQLNVDASRGDELGRVADGINEMARGLVLRERIRDAFGRFVNPQVAEAFIRESGDGGGAVRMGGQRREVAVLMADIRHFTPLSEALPPEALTELLNGYFQEMVAAIQRHGGMVDKFIGDAVMAVFGLSGEPENAPGEAVAAALAMREALEKLNRERRERGDPTLENGIGIHFGEVVAGYIGSQDRLEFTVIGHTVNIAARIEGETRPPNPPLLFSQAVAERLGGRFPVTEMAQARLKGISGAVRLFTVTEGSE